jgi:hypothetical protein
MQKGSHSKKGYTQKRLKAETQATPPKDEKFPKKKDFLAIAGVHQ